MLGYSKIDPLEAKGNHLAVNSSRNTALKVTNCCYGPKGYFPNDNLEKINGLGKFKIVFIKGEI